MTKRTRRSVAGSVLVVLGLVIGAVIVTALQAEGRERSRADTNEFSFGYRNCAVPDNAHIPHSRAAFWGAVGRTGNELADVGYDLVRFHGGAERRMIAQRNWERFEWRLPERFDFGGVRYIVWR